MKSVDADSKPPKTGQCVMGFHNLCHSEIWCACTCHEMQTDDFREAAQRAATSPDSLTANGVSNPHDFVLGAMWARLHLHPNVTPQPEAAERCACGGLYHRIQYASEIRCSRCNAPQQPKQSEDVRREQEIKRLRNAIAVFLTCADERIDVVEAAKTGDFGLALKQLREALDG